MDPTIDQPPPDDPTRPDTPPGPSPEPPPQPGTNGWARAALVLGILAVLFGLAPLVSLASFLLGGTAVIGGVLAVRQSRTGAGGRGLAIAGIATGGLGIVMATVWLIGTLTFLRSVGDELAGLDDVLGEPVAAGEAADRCAGGFSFGLPEGWPASVPMPDDFAVMIPPIDIFDGGELSTLIAVVDSPQALVDFYVDGLTTAGYDVIAVDADHVDPAGGRGAMIHAEGSHEVTVVVTGQDDVPDCANAFIDVLGG